MVPDGSLARVPGLPELAALGDELRWSCSLAVAGNRGEGATREARRAEQRLAAGYDHGSRRGRAGR